MHLIETRDPDDWAKRVQGPLTADFDPAALRAHAPDAHWIWFDGGGMPRARCSLWWNEVPELPERSIGVVGHFAALDPDAARALLDHACRELAARGRDLAVGPMDGNTWRRYRLVTETGREPPFFLEPTNPPDWPAMFEASGFTPLAHYTSALNPDLGQTDPRVARAEQRLAAQGVRLRPLDPARFDDELAAIYELSLEAFRDNFLYTPIGRDEFLAQYRKVQPVLDPRLTLIGESDGRMAGYAFALPDLAQKLRGEAVDTLIVKTVAVRPGRAYAGLGAVLVAKVQQTARELGYRRAIHALMHESNNSRNLSGVYAETMRRYTLYARTLTP